VSSVNSVRSYRVVPPGSSVTSNIAKIYIKEILRVDTIPVKIENCCATAFGT